MSYEAFQGRVTFHMLPQSLGTDHAAAMLSKRVLAALPAADDETRALVSGMAYQIEGTEKIDFTFDGKERRGLVAFREWWLAHCDLTPAELWEQRQALPHAVFIAWDEAWQEEQRMFDVPLDHLPTSALTPTQRLEAQDPDSFLVTKEAGLPGR